MQCHGAFQASEVQRVSVHCRSLQSSPSWLRCQWFASPRKRSQTSAFNILSKAVNILTPGGADGFELTNGYLRVWAGNSQRTIGNNFGADGLVDYFGPNVGASNANKASATMWMDRDGNAYWGGAIAAGILRNAAQSTTTQTIGTSVLVGPFDTNGRSKQVVVGYNRRHTRIKNGFGSDGFVAGVGSNSGVINLYRQLIGQNETLWQQIPISGRVKIFNETDSNDRAVSYWTASVTLNDSGDGAARRSYRAEIVSYSEQSVTHQSGSFTSQTITLSVVTVPYEDAVAMRAGRYCRLTATEEAAEATGGRCF